MKNITKAEVAIYKDILFTILLVIVSIPIWLNFDVAAFETAKYYDKYNYVEYEFTTKPEYSLTSVSDDYAMTHIETSDLTVYNFSNTVGNYKLVLKLDKSIDTGNLKLNVNNDIEYLNNYSSYSDKDNNYYIIDSSEIVASSKKYVLSIWNDESANIKSDATLPYEFMVV